MYRHHHLIPSIRTQPENVCTIWLVLSAIEAHQLNLNCVKMSEHRRTNGIERTCQCARKIGESL